MGSSLEAESRLLHETPALAGRVEDLGHVSDEERLALLAGAELTLFPSYYEGFGFVPFESAALGTACVYTYGSSMKELLPQVGGLPSFDLEEAGPFVAGLLASDARRREVVEAIDAAARDLTWDRAAAGYLEVYDRALAREPRPVSRRLLDLIPGPDRTLRADSEVLLVDVYRRRRGFRLAADAAVGAGRAAMGGVRRARGWASGSDGEGQRTRQRTSVLRTRTPSSAPQLLAFLPRARLVRDRHLVDLLAGQEHSRGDLGLDREPPLAQLQERNSSVLIALWQVITSEIQQL